MSTENETFDIVFNDPDAFNNEEFIEEMKNLPCLWDYNSEGYNYRIERTNAWMSLCNKFYDDFEEMEENVKDALVAKLQKKWKALRDCFNRELKRKSTKGNRHRQYIYFNQLSFLQPLADNKTSKHVKKKKDLQRNALEKTEEAALEITPTVVNTEVEKNIKRKISESSVDHESEQSTDFSYTPKPDPLSQCNHVDNGEHSGQIDSDKHFLLSLYNHFKAIDPHLKLQAQIDILNVLNNYKTYSTST